MPNTRKNISKCIPTLAFFSRQGVFRGLQDTKTPFYATAASNAINILIVPLFIYTLGWGVKGAAAATVLAQLLPCAFLLKTLAARLGGKLTAAAGGWRDVAALFAPTGELKEGISGYAQFFHALLAVVPCDMCSHTVLS